MTSVSSSQLPPAFYRAPKEVQERFLKTREDNARSKAAENRWDIATKVDTAIAVIALAPLTLLTGCDGEKLPPEIPPRDFDTEETQPASDLAQKSFEQAPVYDENLHISLKDLSVKTGNKPAEMLPVLTVGYTNGNWEFRRFQGEANHLGLTYDNLEPEDAENAAFGLCAPNGGLLQPADITGKTIAVMNPDTSSVLEIGDWVIFPRIYVKGDTPNPLATPENTDVCNPLKYLTGEDAKFFYDTGMTLQAPYYFNPDFQWTVYAYADRDIVSQDYGGAEGRVVDPDMASMRWWAWADDTKGVPKNMWTVWQPNTNAPSSYNTISLISGASMEQKHDFFSGLALPETLPGWPPVPDMPEVGVPRDGLTYYNTERNSFDRYGFSIPDRAYSPLVYVAPFETVENQNGEAVGNLCHRTDNLHVQFMIINTGFAKPDNREGLYCNINFFQRNTE